MRTIRNLAFLVFLGAGFLALNTPAHALWPEDPTGCHEGEHDDCNSYYDQCVDWCAFWAFPAQGVVYDFTCDYWSEEFFVCVDCQCTIQP